jgi:methanogenic corrinoid protein MtbC1
MSHPETPRTHPTAVDLLEASAEEIAGGVVDAEFRSRPELEARFGEAGRRKCEKDAQYHIAYLAEAISAGAPELFVEYVAWARALLAGRGIDADDLVTNLRFLRDGVQQALPPDEAAAVASYIDHGISSLESDPEGASQPDTDGDRDEHTEIAHLFLERLLAGDRRAASQLILDAVRGGMSVRDVYLHVFQRSQHEIGRLWQLNRISVAQEHYCTAATQLIMGQLYEYVFASERTGHSMVATCVSGDLHEIGIRMISDFFEMEGWNTYYLGANAPTVDVVRTITERRVELLAVSATMTYHVRQVRELIAAVRACEPCREVKVLVGGFPFNIAPGLWKEIGADGVARDAAEAVLVGQRLVEEGTK